MVMAAGVTIARAVPIYLLNATRAMIYYLAAHDQTQRQRSRRRRPCAERTFSEGLGRGT
jgi:hypothetical protein